MAENRKSKPKTKPNRIQVACVASITTRNGKKIYAKHYGKKCFPIYKTVEVRA